MCDVVFAGRGGPRNTAVHSDIKITGSAENAGPENDGLHQHLARPQSSQTMRVLIGFN